MQVNKLNFIGNFKDNEKKSYCSYIKQYSSYITQYFAGYPTSIIR